ncbi:YmfQ family protein [Pseudomonas sp. SC3(2021)]|uniref:YmfQ family protein n=1 Tax=Pseudomonas sp. SC3(2021) TaxID=2871493 RepID=UPI001C9D70CE|nr:putative phage tail protein [Pseudomonas sp. SC3(2021)]
MGGIKTAAQYQAQLRALLPAGPAWDPEQVPELEEVLQGVAVELARLDARAADLLNEMDPAGVSELVPDWERVMDLPDPCLGATPLFGDRRIAVRERLTAVGAQNATYFIEIARSQGYPNAFVTEFEVPRMGRSRFGRSCFGSWRSQYIWVLNTGGRQSLGRRFGASYWGERFGVNPGSALECLIHRNAPAHTLVFINYN